MTNVADCLRVQPPCEPVRQRVDPGADRGLGAGRLVAVQLAPQPVQERLIAAIVVLDGFRQLVAWQLARVSEASRSSSWNTRISSSPPRLASAFKESSS
jgi:hypothetical protein